MENTDNNIENEDNKHLLLGDKIIINKYNGKCYIIFGLYVYQFNGELIEVEKEDIYMLYNNEQFVTLSQVNIESFFKYLQSEYDTYDILNKNDNFYKKGRLLCYNSGEYRERCIITNITYQKGTENKDIETIDIVTESGTLVSIHYTSINDRLMRNNKHIDIIIDLIVEILNFYDLDVKPVIVTPFLGK